VHPVARTNSELGAEVSARRFFRRTTIALDDRAAAATMARHKATTARVGKAEG